MILEIWVCKNPWYLKKPRTKFGFSGVLKWTFLEAKRTCFGDNPHVFIRYETTVDC